MTTSELGFLCDLLLNHKLPKGTKLLIAERIKMVEANLIAKPQEPAPIHPFVAMPAQAATPPAVIAHSPVAMQAMAARQQIMAGNSTDLDKSMYRAKPKPAPQ